ncbi:beta-galactosidase GalB [Lutibacter citreus]|uniref:beta-galactosidase GalB n=1 Tax=Lutibacter citreus TaxID=2138210 RepID=UPI000DBE6F5B|nr:beta-galactosidase GalB [Lutibacter citreus]
MKKILILLILIGFQVCAQTSNTRDVIPFNQNWKFARFGEMPDGSEKEELEGIFETNFDDSDWRKLNLPHDWGIEGPFRKDLPNRTGKLPWPGIGWYRKSFQSPNSDKGKRVFIEFDGAMSGTTVWLNGCYVGEWPYGYSSFRFEITHQLKVGEGNKIAVRLNNKNESSRWYPGGGIYRNVRLVRVNPIHIDHWGVFVSTSEVTNNEATVKIETQIKNLDTDIEVKHEISKINSTQIVARATGRYAKITLNNPRLWSLDSPNMYKVTSKVFKDGVQKDEVVNTFGVRSIKYTAEGFFLNGKKTKLNGVCMHSDLGPLGMAVNTRAMERQIEILQSFGCNAIRTSHNPPAPEYLDLCDKMGMLVQVEAFDSWRHEKTQNDYSNHFGAWHQRDLQAMVKRDRNHPSVIMWSTGNEVREERHFDSNPMVTMLAGVIKDEDPTRPVSFGCSNATAALNGFGAKAEVMGVNYKPELYGQIREKFPNMPLYASETTSSISSRGEYFFPVSEVQREGVGGYFQVSDYGLYASPNGYPADVEFKAQDMNPFVIGEFVWTGFDYIGEPTPFNKDKTNLLNYTDVTQRERVKAEMAKLGKQIPPRSSYFGIVDLCGFPKDRYYLYQSRWKPELPMAHILPHWNWEDRIGKVTPVHVYTSGDEAELFLNGESLGRKKKGKYEYRLGWNDVVYKPGNLKVVSYKNGNKWAEETIKTTGKVEKIELKADRSNIIADGKDLCFVTVRVTDSNGVTVPRTHNLVKFTLKGPGEIIAIGNGDSTDLEPFQSNKRKVFNGLALVIIRTKNGESGKLELLAESAELKMSKLEIKVNKEIKR